MTRNEGEEPIVDYLDRPCGWRWWAGPMSANRGCSTSCWARNARWSGPEAGLTRDAITAPWKAGDRDVLLHDTAGLRKKARVAGETLEEMSVASTLEAIRFADCVIVMIDATAPVRKTGPHHRRSDRARGPRHRLCRQQMGPAGEQGGRDLAAAREAGPAVAAGGGRAAGGDLGAHRRRARPAGAAVIAGRPGLEHPHPHLAAQPFPGGGAAAPCHARHSGRRVRIRYMTQRKSAAAQLYLVRQPARRFAGSLSALSAERIAREFRSGGHAAALRVRNSKNPYATRNNCHARAVA